MFAVNTIRTEPNYRRAAFDAGLESLGYQLATSGRPKGADDLLVLWNRQGLHEAEANQWEKDGGTVIVAENGYAGKDAIGHQFYAISERAHNGAGRFPVGAEDRFGPLGIELAPWRETDGYILVCGQRGIGSRQMASPPQWDDKTVQRLRAMGYRNIKLRRHPGRAQPRTTLDQDLSGAAVCLIWSSSSGVKALALGIPVVCCAPHWICEAAAGRGLDAIAAPVRDDTLRRAAMHCMSHGQWSVDEIEVGEPFKRLLPWLREQ